jgi:hypothetical protein
MRWVGTTSTLNHASSGHGFQPSRFRRPLKNPSALPKAGAKAKPQRLNCFPFGSHQLPLSPYASLRALTPEGTSSETGNIPQRRSKTL